MIDILKNRIKMNIKFLFFLLLFTRMFFPIHNGYALISKDKILLLSDYKCPYACNPLDSNQGYLVEIIKNIFRDFDVDVEYKLVSHTDAMSQLKSGVADIVLGAFKEELDDKFLTYPICTTISAYTLDSNNWVYVNNNSLNNVIIGSNINYLFQGDFKQVLYSNYISHPENFIFPENSNASLDNFNNLIDKKIEVLIEDDNIVNFFIQKTNNKSIINAGPITQIKMYIAFNIDSPKGQKYITIFNNDIKILNKTANAKNLIKKYNLSTLKCD